MSRAEIYNVWTDGSYQHTKKKGGIGYVINHDSKLEMFSAPLPPLSHAAQKHGSDYAELYAVAAALKVIPNEAMIRLRMDCQNVIDWLKGRNLTCKPETRAVLGKVFHSAIMEVQQKAGIEFIKVSDRNNEGMALAHKLSREGALKLCL